MLLFNIMVFFILFFLYCMLVFDLSFFDILFVFRGAIRMLGEEVRVFKVYSFWSIVVRCSGCGALLYFIIDRFSLVLFYARFLVVLF